VNLAPKDPEIYGVMAEYHTPQELLEAIHAAKDAGWKTMDAFTPYPIEEVFEELGHHHSKVPLIVLVGGIIGGIGGFFLQYWVSAIEYPINIGGRPFNSWPAFIPVTFECTILLAALSAVFGMFALNGLPQPYHPVFNVKGFALASRNRYFLLIEHRDPKFTREAARTFLSSTNAHEVSDVEP
jgi:hypothetical protein